MRRQRRQKRREIRAKDALPTPAPPAGKSDDISQRGCDLPIPYRKAIPGNYELNDDDEKKTTKLKEGISWS